MIEPETPVTFRVKYTFRPAFLLESDEGKPLPPSSVILRHRHLRQQQRTIQGGIVPGEGPGARATRGIVVATTEAREPVPPSAAPIIEPVVAPPPPPPSHPASTSAESPASNAAAGPEVQPEPDAVRSTQPVRSTRQTRGHLRLDDSVHDRRQSVLTSIGPLDITYSWRSLRTRGEKTRGEKTSWFSSAASQLLDVPPTLSLVKPGDLYIHNVDNGVAQAWLRTSAPAWVSVDTLHPHPYLRGYVLNFLKNGEPSWVTKDTVRTYKGRIEKRAREANKRQSSAGPSRPL
ncbi:hypothetical protein C8T65DRAFT_747082 [Cerioporus squamosus]|nr:hypothetical protein C8T65DRAFT_747082 [Cerioporus squamosus]